MPSLPPRPTRLSVTELPFYVFLVTLGLCLFRAADLPSLDVGVGGTTLSIGPADPALLVTAVLAVRELWLRRRVPSPWLLGAIAAFAVLIVLSAIPNSAGAVTAAGKLSDFAVLALGAAAFIDTRQRFADLAWFLVAFCTVAVAWGAVEFVVNGGKRQGSFMGEHDLAALSTMALVLGLAYLFDRDRRPPTVGLVGIVVGAVGIVLGASLASVLGLYLGAVAMVALALVRRDLRRRAVVVTVLICAAVTAGTYGLRSADLGFLQSWFGPPPETPGQYAASWSHRLIYVYIGGPGLPRQPGLRHRLGGRAAAARLRAVSRRRARALLRPAAALLPAGDGHADPAADVGSGALRAGTRRSRALRRAGRARDPRRGRRRPPAAAGRAVGRAGLRAAGLARGDRRRDRRSGALRRLAAGGALLAGARRRGGPSGRAGADDVSLSIVHVIARLNVGGAALHVLQLAHEQARRGHDVVVVAGTLAAGEESMEYVADELGVRPAPAARAAA